MAKRNFSSKRNAIYNLVCGTTTHPSARWIYDSLKPDIPDLSLGTVYRNISLFKQEGTLNVVCTVNGEERLDAKTTPHPHFVCNCCGKVIDIGENDCADSEARRLCKAGYTVESRLVLYYGVCLECSAKSAAE